jgi:cytosine/adenosine deaminase-related metal-dependent hydrolase
MSDYDLVLRDAYIYERDEVLDIGVVDGTIDAVSPKIDATADEEIDAKGNLVSPGLVDAHMHIDKAFAAAGDRIPKGHDDSFSFERISSLEDDYYENASIETIRDNALRDLQMAIAAGSVYVRSHVSIDPEVRGTDNMTACLEACERASDLVDVQLVPAGRDELHDPGEAVLREAIEAGLAHNAPDEVLLGGFDPASAHHDIEGSLRGWFDLATAYDLDMDLHIHDGGTLGIYTLERLLSHIDEYGYKGRVTASHSYALANVQRWRVRELIDEFLERKLKLVTCYQSTRPAMPVRLLLTEDIVLGHGTDNDRDFVFPHGNADSVEAMLIESNKLHGDRAFDREYRWFDTTDGLAALWDMITRQGAAVFGMSDSYGIEEGTPADLVVFNEPSPHWTIIKQSARPYVIKDGEIVARNGSIVPEHRLVE